MSNDPNQPIRPAQWQQQQSDYVATAPPAPEEVHLADYWALIVAGRKIIYVCLAVALLAGIVISIFTKPTYRARTVLFLDKNQASPFEAEEGGSPRTVAYDPEFLPTQIQLIKGRDVAERVVTQLDLANSGELNAPKKGWWWKEETVEGSAEAEVERIAEKIQEQVEVTPVRGSTVVHVYYTAESPKLAAQVVNAVANSYIDWTLESKFQVINQVNQFTSVQIEQLKAEIDKKARQLQEYGAEKDIISLDASNVTMQNLESVNRDYTAAVADRVAKEARYNEVMTGRPEGIADTASNGLISQLRAEQARLEREYSEKLSLYKPQWPGMIQLKAQIEKSRQHIASEVARVVEKAREEARAEYLTAARREQSLKAVIGGQKKEAQTQNSNSVEYNNLKVEVDTKRALLDVLLKKQAENQILARSRGQRVSNVRVVERAPIPRSKFRPSYKRNLALSLLLGLFAGVAVIFTRDYLDRSVKSAEQVVRFLRLAVLGVIPAVDERGEATAYGYSLRKKKNSAPTSVQSVELIPHRAPRAVISEAYRALRTALLLSQPGGVSSFVITSSLPGEGKTTTAANLGIVLGQLGKRVLIIDADLHKPRMHEVFNISNRVGLVSVLTGTAKPSQAMVQPGMPGVYVLPSGPIPPNPSRLIASETMKNLLVFAKTHFDVVLLDSPPVSPIADALLLGHLTDGIVLTVKAHKTPRNIVARVRDDIMRANVTILGVLLNSFVEKAPGYGTYSYYAAYGQQEAPAEPTAAAT